MIRFSTNLAACAYLWVLLTEARMDSWIVGGPAVVAAAFVAVRSASGRRWRWSVVGFFRFAPHFVCSSFLGGLDVAWRSLHPRLPIDPRLIAYHLRLPEGTERVFFMNVVNLLPGTLSADICDDVLTVHVIDGQQPIHEQLTKLEQAVAGLFAIRFVNPNDAIGW